MVLDLGKIKEELNQLKKPPVQDDQASLRQELKSNAEQDIKMEDAEDVHEQAEMIEDQGNSEML